MHISIVKKNTHLKYFKSFISKKNLNIKNKMAYFESKRIITAYQNKEGSIESLIAKSVFTVSNIINKF
jgi:hypothetical protein